MIGTLMTHEAMKDMIAKTIEKVEYGLRDTPSEVQQAEMLVLRFTDGSSVSITIGSNIASVASDFEGLEPQDVSTDIIAQFHNREDNNLHPNMKELYGTQPE
jgi:hypothetical protein